MVKKTMAELLEAVTSKKAFKSDDTVSEIEQVGLDASAPDDEIDELEVDGKSKAGLSAEQKNKKISTKSVSEAKDEDEDEEDEDDNDSDSDDEEEDEDLKEALRLFGSLVEAELDEEFGEDDEDEDEDEDEDLEEGRTAHPMSADELAIRKKITANSALIHYYEKRKKAGTKYNKTKGSGSDLNALKKENEVLKGQLKAKRAKSHPKNKSMLNNSVEVDVRKVTVEDFDSSADLAAIFGTDETLSEGFVTKAKNIYDASVIAKSNEVIQEVYGQLKEAFVSEQEILVSELTEAFSAKVDELTESMDKYLDKTIANWKRDNEVALASKAKFEISESFMTKLKTLFEDHYIDLPEEKVSVVESMQIRINELEENLQKEVDANIVLTEQIEEKNRMNVIEEMSEGLSDNQKQKFSLLAESLDSSDREVFVEKLEEIKSAYFKNSGKKVIAIEEDLEEEIILEEKKPVSDNAMVNGAVSAISKYLSGKK